MGNSKVNSGKWVMRSVVFVFMIVLITGVSPGAVIDLISLVDLDRNVVSGTWELVEGELVSIESPPALISFPYRPPLEYDYTVEFTLEHDGDNTVQLASHGDVPFTWNFPGGPGGGYRSRLADINGHSVIGNPTLVPYDFLAGHRYTSTVRVRNDRVICEIDGEVLVEYLTDYSDLSRNPRWEMPDQLNLGLGGYGSSTTFHSVTVTAMPTEPTPCLRVFPVVVAGGDQTFPDIDADTVVWRDANSLTVRYKSLASGQENEIVSSQIGAFIIGNRLAIDGKTIVWVDERNAATVPNKDKGDLFGYDIDTKMEYPVWQDGLQMGGVDVAGDIVGGVEHVAGDNHDIYIYDLASKMRIPICTERDAQTMPVTNGRMVVWADRRGSHGDPEIYAYDLQTQTEMAIATTSEHGGGEEPAISGNAIVWTKPGGDIYGYDMATDTVFSICTEPGTQRPPDISGSIVVWADNRNGNDDKRLEGNWDIYGYDLETKTEFPICVEAGCQAEPRISGNTVVWMDNRNGDWDIYGATLFPKPTPCLPEAHPDYEEWVAVGKPECWCYPRHCYGDADGKNQGGGKVPIHAVHYDDLNVLIAAWKVQEPPDGPGIESITAPNGQPGICADFSHSMEGGYKTGYYRVHFWDLNALISSWNVQEPPLGPGIPRDCGGLLGLEKENEIPHGDVVVDGNLKEWGADTYWLDLDEVYYGAPNDITYAKFALRWNADTDRIYAAVVVEDTDHFFSDEYIHWDASDRVEVYCQGSAAGGTDWLGVYDKAQQYHIVPGATIEEWVSWATGEQVSSDVGLEYAVRQTGYRIMYEIAIPAFENYGGISGDPTVRSNLISGKTVGLDVTVCSRMHDGGFGMLAVSGNSIDAPRVDNADNFTKYVLVGNGGVGPWIDLASSVDAERDATDAGWVHAGDSYVFSAQRPRAYVSIPYALTGSYEFETHMTIERSKETVQFLLPVEAHYIQFDIQGDNGNSESATATMKLAGLTPEQLVWDADKINIGREYEYAFDISIDGSVCEIEICVDDETLYEWNGALSDIKPNLQPKYATPSWIELETAYYTIARFSDIKVRTK